MSGTDAASGRGTCESCGDLDVEVVLVRRLYVTPEAWDQAGRVDAAGVEAWCFVCRTHYPHHELDATGQPVDHELGWDTTGPTP
jgi:hypothetical protein